MMKLKTDEGIPMIQEIVSRDMKKKMGITAVF
jgi:hypothetical protein